MRYFIGIWMFLSGYSALAQDLALAEPGGDILQPVSGCSLTSTENVSVRIFNFGNDLPAGTFINVSYTVNSGTPVAEALVLSSALLSHSSYTYTFTTPVDLSTPGNYTFDATVSLAGDINPSNNSIIGHVVTNSANSAGGSVSSDQTICGTTNSGTLTLSGSTGDITRWETSEDEGLTWRYVSQTTTQQNFLNLETTTQYRAVVKNGACDESTSSLATITIICQLPLTWISFDARRRDNNVELEWKTADEVNTLNFVVERNTGDHLFRSIGTVPAQSPSGRYQYTDRNAPGTALEYRIRQVDLDNRLSYSPILRIGGIGGPPSLKLRNNPVNSGMLSFDVKGYPTGNAVITIFNMNGKKIRSVNVQLNSGDQTVDIPVHGIAAGIYMMTIRSGDLFSKKKVMILQNSLQ